MKALSVQQPWAWALFHGKPVENRDRAFSHRGLLLIQASKTFNDEGMAWLLLNREGLGLSLDDFPRRAEDFKRGGLVGIVNLTDVVQSHPSPYFFGPHGHVFKNPGEFKSMITFRGMPGLFDVPEKIVLEALQLLNKCPQCGENLIYANLGNGTVDTYCEECGFPDENRTAAELEP